MKRKIVLSALMMGIVLSMYYSLAATLPTTRVPLEAGKFLYTAAMPWKTLRTPAAETAATAYDFTAANGGWSDICVDAATIAATNGLIDVMEVAGGGWGGNGIEIAFFSEDDAADDAFGIEIFAFADSLYGPAIPVYTTTTTGCSVGTRICTTHPVSGATQASGLWVDKITGTDYWGGVTITNSDTNSICIVRCDMRGYRYWWVRIIGAHGTKIGAVYKTH